MTTVKVLTKVEYQFKLRKNIDALKARIRQAPYIAPTKDQDKVLLYFANRAIQIGEACFRIDDLPTPLLVLTRVICEDLFVVFWVSQSEKNTVEYCKMAKSEPTRLLRTNIKNRRARIRDTKTGRDVTKSFLPVLNKLITDKAYIERIATISGLGKVYDTVYRVASLETHGNTFDLSEVLSVQKATVAISAVNALLRVILNIVDSTVSPLTAEEVLTILNMKHLAGRD